MASDLVVTGTLDVHETSTFDDSITCRSTAFVTGFLRVGALAAVGYNVLEIAQVNQDLTVSGNTTLQGPLIVDDLIRTNAPHGIVCGGELHVAQNTVLQETLQVLGPVQANSTLTVTGKASFQGAVGCSGTMNPSGGLYTSLVTIGSATIGTTHSGKIIYLNTATTSCTIGTNVTAGSVFNIVVEKGTSDRTLIAPTGGSITCYTNIATGATATSTKSIKSKGPATLVLVQTSDNNWVPLAQCGVWTATA